jgi:hypothetical protein
MPQLAPMIRGSTPANTIQDSTSLRHSNSKCHSIKQSYPTAHSSKSAINNSAINQPTNQAISTNNQCIKAPSIQSINHSINPTINQSITQPSINRVTNQSITINQPLHRSLNHSTNQSVSQSLNQSITQSITQLFKQSITSSYTSISPTIIPTTHQSIV